MVHPADEFVEDGGFCLFDGFGVFFALLQFGVGGFDELKLTLVAHAVHVYPCALSDPAGLCFTDGQKRDLHEAKVFYLRCMVSQSMERLIRFALEEDLGTGDCT